MARKQTGLGPRHIAIYDFIVDYQLEYCKSPTFREIMEGANIPSVSLVAYYLDRLVQHRWIVRRGQRDIKIVGGPSMQSTTMKTTPDGVREVRDQNMGILLISLGHTVVGSRREGSTVYVSFDAKETEEHVQAFKSNKPIPMDDARMLILGMATWKALVRELT